MKRVKRLFFIILCICVAFSSTTALFTSCKALPNDPIDTPEQTEESKAPEDLTTSPEETTDTEQETDPEEETTQPQKIELEPLDLALLEQIEAQYNEANPSNPRFFMDYFGTYNGYIALRSAGNLDVSFEEIVAGVTIKHPENRGITLWKNWQFYTLTEAYDQGLLTINNIQTIADIANNNWYLNLKEEPLIEALDEEVFQKIKKDINFQHYYGTYSDYAVVVSLTVLDSVTVIEVDGIKLTFPKWITLTLWKDGETLTLQEAYDQGKITLDDLKALAMVRTHKWYYSYLNEAIKH